MIIFKIDLKAHWMWSMKRTKRSKIMVLRNWKNGSEKLEELPFTEMEKTKGNTR